MLTHACLLRACAMYNTTMAVTAMLPDIFNTFLQPQRSLVIFYACSTVFTQLRDAPHHKRHKTLKQLALPGGCTTLVME